MAHSNWAWLKAVNPDVSAHESRWVKPVKGSSTCRFDRRLGSFWDNTHAPKKQRTRAYKASSVASGKMVKAQVWDAKRGEFVLRMVPVE